MDVKKISEVFRDLCSAEETDYVPFRPGDVVVFNAGGSCRYLPTPDRRGAPAGGVRTVRTLTPEEINEMRGTSELGRGVVPVATRRWHEGSTLIGYWPDGDSYVFDVDGHKLCVSRGYLEEMLRDTTPN